MQTFFKCALILGVAALFFFVPEEVWALAGVGNFESKLDNLNKNLVSRLLPLVATCGLVYAAFLMAIGSPEARSKALAVIGGSILGFLAPALMKWLSGVF